MRVPIEYLSEVRGDMRYAVRALLKSPGFAFVGIISMGLSIGLTTNVYSSKWALLFRDLPAAANAKNLVMPEKPVSYYYIEQFREQKNLFAGVAAFQIGVPFNVIFQGNTNAKPERVFGQHDGLPAMRTWRLRLCVAGVLVLAVGALSACISRAL